MSPSNLSQKVSFKTGEGRRLQVFQRARVSGEVLIHDDERLFIAPLDNISAGGVFVDQLVAMSVGKTVRIVVKSPKLEQPVQAVGTVVRIEKDGRHGLAVEFTSINSRDREIIQNCVFESRMETVLRAA